MEFREYVKGIAFEKVQPNDPIHWLETTNVYLPSKIMEDELIDICSIPKMSTFAIGALINKAVSEIPEDQCFVNVGVWHGFTLLAGMIGNHEKKCIGIDNFSEFGGPRLEFRKRYLEARSENHQFYELDYRQYFQSVHKSENKIGFYIYDGAHDYENQLLGLTIAEPFLADDAMIMVDDTNWPDPYNATKEFMEKSKHNWEIILDEKTSENGHPTWWNGIMIIKKGGLK